MTVRSMQQSCCRRDGNSLTLFEKTIHFSFSCIATTTREGKCLDKVGEAGYTESEQTLSCEGRSQAMDEQEALDIMNGHPLRVERCRRNMTQAELAEAVKVGVTTIWRAEKDYPISAASRQRICTYFGLTSQELGLNRKEKTFHNAFSKSIADGWNCFHTGRNAQVLVTGQSLLFLAQHYYSSFSSTASPVLYSPTYLLVTAGHYFQGCFRNALNSSKKAYILALEACDTWNMAESLSWQGGVWKACGQQEKAIQSTKAALHLVKDNSDALSLVTQARLYAHWAESAALLRQPTTVDEMLEASASLLDRIESNLEFDVSTWHYYQGTCAFYLGNMMKAEMHFQNVLQNYPQNSIQQYTNTLLFQAETRLNMEDREGSLIAARSALPLVAKLNAPLISWGFMDYLQKMQAKFPNNFEVKSIVHETQQVLALPTRRIVPRYLEGKL